MSNRDRAENFESWYQPEDDPDYIPDEVWKGEETNNVGNSKAERNRKRKEEIIRDVIRAKILKHSFESALKILRNDNILLSVDADGHFITGTINDGKEKKEQEGDKGTGEV